MKKITLLFSLLFIFSCSDRELDNNPININQNAPLTGNLKFKYENVDYDFDNYNLLNFEIPAQASAFGHKKYEDDSFSAYFTLSEKNGFYYVLLDVSEYGSGQVRVNKKGQDQQNYRAKVNYTIKNNKAFGTFTSDIISGSFTDIPKFPELPKK